MTIPWRRMVLVGLALAYVTWASAFIWRSSVATNDGRYFCLFDDAMVSLRYAWNLAHGQGLVWNPGERVEGITSMLFTLFMALGALFLSKSAAALFVQITAIPLVLVVAWMAGRLSQALACRAPVGPGWLLPRAPSSNTLPSTAPFLSAASGLVAAGAVLAYYPVSYWALMGMETGLLTALALAALLVAMSLSSDTSDQEGASPDLRRSLLLGLLLGLMVATRPDAAVPSAAILAFRAAWILHRHRRLDALRRWLVEVGVLVGVVACLTLFRWAYYGSLLPNTYDLKMANWPLHWRLRNGWRYVLPFFDSSRYLLGFSLCSVVLHRDVRRLLLFCFAVSIIAGQIWVGGDAWSYWRMLVPGVVPLIVLTVDGAGSLIGLVTPREWRLVTMAFTVLCSAKALWAADAPFIDELRMKVPAYTVSMNQARVQDAIELSRYVRPEGSVAVFAAGVVPYYSGLRGVDAFGKSDRYVANLPGLGFADGRTVTPGHNKFDLRYSIVRLRPDAIYDALAWARYDGQDVLAFVRRYYAQQGTFWLRRDSPYLYRDRLPPDWSH